jgi:5-methylcytosine-specific restriction endonuclease McrA
MTRKNLIRLFIVATFGLLSSLTVAHGGVEHGGDTVKGMAKADKLDACVKETPFMRRNHFELIKHQRDVTVHEGIRKTNDSLAGCVDCHAKRDEQGKAIPVDEPGQFCESCHAYTAVTIDCFSCHSAVPTAANATAGSKDPAVIEQAHAAIEKAQGTGN